MGLRTDIHYADSTLNLVMGCTGCHLHPHICYAKQLCDRYRGRTGWPRCFERPELFLHRLDAALRWPDLRGLARPDKPWLDGLPRIVFVNDLGDGFCPDAPAGWLPPLLPRLAASRHIWLLLTKWPDRLAEELAGVKLPWNIWPGTTITTAPELGKADHLAAIDAVLRWISFEPILGDLCMCGIFNLTGDYSGRRARYRPAKDAPVSPFRWAVFGGQSGRRARPLPIDWIRDCLAQCDAGGVIPFVKQLGRFPVIRAAEGDGPKLLQAQQAIDREWPEGTRFGNTTGGRQLNGRVAILKDPKGGDWDEWPADLRVRFLPL